MKTIHIIIFFTAVFGFGQGFVSSVQAQVLAQSDFSLKTSEMEKDKLGTKTETIKVFEVGVDKAKNLTGGPFTVKLYLDGRYYHKYDNAPMPFEFKQNFKGLNPGTHAFKIEITDADGKVLSTQETSVDVSGKGKN